MTDLTSRAWPTGAVGKQPAFEAWRSPAMLPAVLEMATVGMALTDLAGRVLVANAALGELLGADTVVLVGRPLAEFLAPGDGARLDEMLRDLAAGHRAVVLVDQDFRQASGRLIQGRLRARLVSGEPGQPPTVVVVMEPGGAEAAEAVRRRSEARERAFLDANPDLLLVVRGDGTFVDVKASQEVPTLLPPAAFLGKTIDEVLPTLADAVRAAIGQALATGTVQLLEYQLPVGGTVRSFEARLVASGADEVLAIIRDITDRTRAEMGLRLLAEAGTLLAASLDYATTLQQVAQLAVPVLADLCLVDMLVDDGSCERVATAHADPALIEVVQALRRYPPDPAGSQAIPTVIRTGQAQLTPEMTAAYVARIARDEEHLRLIKSLAPTSSMVVPLRARGRTLGAISFVATGSRRYGAADLALAEELAGRCALAVDNARLYGEAQAAVQLREEFLSIASHELRTPLTSIKGYVQLLARQVRRRTLDRERLGEMTAALQQQVGRLEALVSDLLDVSRIRQGRLELRPEWVALGELARAVVARLEQAPFRRPTHRLVVDQVEPVKGLWDRSQLDRALTNLVANALKYSPAGGDVRVTVRRDGEEAIVAVADQGPGIAAEEQGSLFQPFSRGRAADQGVPGVGLGLHIAAQIVERHGGTISLESSPGAGSTFVIRLPLRRPHAGEAGIGSEALDGRRSPPAGHEERGA